MDTTGAYSPIFTAWPATFTVRYGQMQQIWTALGEQRVVGEKGIKTFTGEEHWTYSQRLAPPFSYAQPARDPSNIINSIPREFEMNLAWHTLLAFPTHWQTVSVCVTDEATSCAERLWVVWLHQTSQMHLDPLQLDGLCANGFTVVGTTAPSPPLTRKTGPTSLIPAPSFSSTQPVLAPTLSQLRQTSTGDDPHLASLLVKLFTRHKQRKSAGRSWKTLLASVSSNKQSSSVPCPVFVHRPGARRYPALERGGPGELPRAHRRYVHR